MVSRQERYINKSTKLSETIKKVNLPKVKCPGKMQISSNVNLRAIKKKLGQAQSQMDIARSRGIPLKEILTFEHCGESLLFNGEITISCQ